MLRTINTCEKNLVALPAAPIAVPNNVSTVVVVDYRTIVNFPHELVYITIQNTGANNAYIAFGQDASAASYHKLIAPSQELSVPFVCQVSAFAVGGTTIVPCVIRREGY